jgi:hypothetical protein
MSESELLVIGIRMTLASGVVTALKGLGAAWANGETTGFDGISVPFWLGAGINLAGAFLESTPVRGALASAHLTLVLAGSYVLFSQGMIQRNGRALA